MKLVRTAKIKLNIAPQDILPTIQAYTKAFNAVCREGYDRKETNGVSLHKLTYQTAREYLPAQLAISSRMKATEALKSIFTKYRKDKRTKKIMPRCPQSKLSSIRYDARSYSIFFERKEISLLTVDGRKKYSLKVPDYYASYFKDWKQCSADLCIDKQSNKVFLHIAFEKDITDTALNGNYIGIDRGINNLAVVSNNKFFGSRHLKQLVFKQNRLRKQLQQKGTQSAKRHLRKLRKKEQRFRADINHQISKNIVASLSAGDTIVLEKLTGIRYKRLRKPQRTMLNNWAYLQLEQFIIYKAQAKGINIVYVDARYTSQGCSKCGFVDRKNREGHGFCCRECGFSLNADLNASRNIGKKALLGYILGNGAVVNQPIVSIEISDTNHQPALMIIDQAQIICP